MKKTKLVFLALFVTNLFFSCASVSTTAGHAETIEEAHPDRFEKTVIGMSFDEFKTVWPEAKKIGASENGEVYEFVYIHLLMGGAITDYKIFTSFYFSNNKLSKYESRKGL